MLVIGRDTLHKIISENDAESLKKIFDAVGFDGRIDCSYNSFNSATIQTILVIASSSARENTLSDEMAHLLISRLAISCDIFNFLEFIVCTTEIKTANYDAIQHMLKEALASNTYCDHVGTMISRLHEQTFHEMAMFIIDSDRVSMLSLCFNAPIMQYVYDHEVVARDQMFLMWASTLLWPRLGT